jgi:hypothetical protein
MRGQIVAFDAGVGEGEIAGDDFTRYPFEATDARRPAALRVGARVDFVITEDGRAREITLVANQAIPRAGGRFDLGRVIQRTFTSISQNWAVYFGAAVALIGVPSLIMGWGQGELSATPAAWRAGSVFGGLVLYLVGFFLLQGMVLKAAINGFQGKSTPFGSAFDVGVRHVLPLIGLAILTFIGLIVGFLFLIVPGIILCVVWAVSAPALVAEQRGVFDSFTRSIDLTSGHRWSVFGLLVIYTVLSWIFGLVAGGIGLALVSNAAGDIDTAPIAVINTLANIVNAVVASVGAASLYYELRTAKEGVGVDELASVFD